MHQDKAEHAFEKAFRTNTKWSHRYFLPNTLINAQIYYKSRNKCMQNKAEHAFYKTFVTNSK